MAFAMLWGHLTSLKYLHHKQHELWGLQEGRCFKIQFPVFSSAGAVRGRASHPESSLWKWAWPRDAWRTWWGWGSPVGQRVEAERAASSSLATVWDRYDNTDTWETATEMWFEHELFLLRSVNNKQAELDSFSLFGPFWPFFFLFS